MGCFTVEEDRQKVLQVTKAAAEKKRGFWWFKPWPFWDCEFMWPFQGVKRDLQHGDEKGTAWITWRMLFSMSCVFSLWILLTVWVSWRFWGNFWFGKKGESEDNDFSTLDACIFILSNGWLSHQKLDGRIAQEMCWRSEETCITPVGLEYDSMLTPLLWCPYNKKTNRYKSGEQRIIECDLGVWHVISLRVEIIPPVMSFT